MFREFNFHCRVNQSQFTVNVFISSTLLHHTSYHLDVLISSRLSNVYVPLSNQNCLGQVLIYLQAFTPSTFNSSVVLCVQLFHQYHHQTFVVTAASATTFSRLAHITATVHWLALQLFPLLGLLHRSGCGKSTHISTSDF